MRVVGIDLGTTYSAVAVVNQHGRPELLPNREGEYLTASVVHFEPDGPVVGTQAKNLAVVSPEDTVQFVKRFMGDRDWRFYAASGPVLSAEDVSALILRRLKEDAEAALGEEVTRAVITVPAYFADAQRHATVDAGRIAGLEVLRVVNEPTAAALAYGLTKGRAGRVVVYDLGGGTFDVTVLDVSPAELRVLSTRGDRNLGGLDWDDALINWLDEQFVVAGGSTLLDDPHAAQDLREKAERAKQALSQTSSARVVLSAGGRHQPVSVTRETFQELTSPLLERTRYLLEEALEDAGLGWPDVSKVLLVGGSTKMPAVVDMVQAASGLKPSRELHPDEVVALGAALQATLSAAEAEQAAGGEVSDQTEAALDAAGLSDVSVTDITNQSLGLVVNDLVGGGKHNDVVIRQGTALPAQREKTYAISAHGQTHLRLGVTQGEGRELEYVEQIGEGTVALHEAKPLGHPVRVRYGYDASGLINVHAWDGQSGTYWGEVKVERRSNLSASELAEHKAVVDSLSSV